MKRNTVNILICAVMCFAAAAVFAEEYDLAAYLEMVERNNPDLLMALKEFELAKTGVMQARAAFLPSAGVQGGYNRNFIESTQSTPVASLPGGGELVRKDLRNNFDNELILGIGVNQVLFSSGAISNYSKARAGQAIQGQSLEAVRQAVICEAKKLYLRAQVVLMVVEIRESSENLSLEQYQRIQRRFQAGSAIEMDLLSAEVDWRTKAAATMEAKKNVQLVLSAMRNLAGIPHSREITLTQKYTDTPLIPESPDLGNVLAGRADYRALLLARDLTDIERKAAASAFLPEISASFSYALGGMGNGSSLTGDYDFDSAALGLRVSIPILTGGARIARVKAAKLSQEKADAALSKKQTAVESELLELRLRLEDSRQRMDAAYRTVEVAERAVTLAQSAYTNGVATYLTVIDAVDRLDQCRLNISNVFFEYMSAYYDWEYAAGVKEL